MNMSDLKNQYQRPEGKLIEAALKGPPKKSMRRLAKDIGRSEGRVRQIINGYQSMAGQTFEIIGPADTVAQMAKAAGVTAEQMKEAGREDAANEMNPLISVGVTEAGELWISSHEEEFAALAAWVELPEDARAGSPPIEALALWEPQELIEAAKHQYASHDRMLQFVIAALGERPTVAHAKQLEARIAELESLLPKVSRKPRASSTIAAIADAQAELDREPPSKRDLLDAEAAVVARTYNPDTLAEDAGGSEIGGA